MTSYNRPIQILQLIILLSIATMQLGVAQETKKNKSLKIQLACIKVKNNLSVLAYRSNTSKQFEKIQLNLNYLSGTIDVMPDENGVVYFYDPTALPQKDKPSSPIASFKSKASGGKLIILLLPSAKVKTTYSCKQILIDGNFKTGSSCIVNLTGKEIYLIKNNKRTAKKISRGKTGVVKPIDGKNEVKLAILTPHIVSKKITKFYSATWTFSPKVREICLIYRNKNSKWPKTKIISGYTE